MIHFIPFEMGVSTAILKEALDPKIENLAARIVAITVIPFLLIAAFEGLVINGARLILNACISVINSTYNNFFLDKIPIAPVPLSLTIDSPIDVIDPIACLDWPISLSLELPPSPEMSPIVSISVSPVAEFSLEPQAFIEMPPISSEHKQYIEFIVKTCAKGWLAAGKNVITLKAHEKELEPNVHPFQFLEVIFGESSTVKSHMPILMKNSIVNEQFLSGLVKGMKNQNHLKLTNDYLHSFAQKVGLTLEKINSFGNWPKYDWRGLVMHLIEAGELKTQSSRA